MKRVLPTHRLGHTPLPHKLGIIRSFVPNNQPQILGNFGISIIFFPLKYEILFTLMKLIVVVKNIREQLIEVW